MATSSENRTRATGIAALSASARNFEELIVTKKSEKRRLKDDYMDESIVLDSDDTRARALKRFKSQVALLKKERSENTLLASQDSVDSKVVEYVDLEEEIEALKRKSKIAQDKYDEQISNFSVTGYQSEDSSTP